MRRKWINTPTFEGQPFVTICFPYELRRLKCLFGLGYYRLGPKVNNGDAAFGLCLTRHFCNILAIGRRNAPPMPLTDSSKGKLLRFHLGPTTQIYCDGWESSLVTLHALFHDRGKIPAARNEDHSSQPGIRLPSTGLAWFKSPINEEAALMRTVREIFYPRAICIEAVGANA